MGAVPFDTLALARKLEAAGFDPKQAQDTAAALAEVLSEQVRPSTTSTSFAPSFASWSSGW